MSELTDDDILRFSADHNKSILAEYNGIKIDEKFIIKLTKRNKNVNKKIKDSCKVLHFSSEWNFEEVLAAIDRLTPKEYSQLFIFIIDTSEVLFEAQEATSEPPNKKIIASHDVNKLKEYLLKFCVTRPMILQLTSENENVTKIYYKKDTSSQFTTFNQQHNKLEESNAFFSFLRSFFDGNFHGSKLDINGILTEFQNRSLALRFLRTLNLSDEFFGSLIMDTTTKGTKAELLAALDSPFVNDGRMLSNRAQQYISDVFGDDDDLESDDSILLRAVQNENKEVIDYLITYWTHLIQQLPFKHQVKISTTAFKKDQLDVLCDLLDIADYPFPKNFNTDSVDHEKLMKITTERNELKAAMEETNFEKIDNFVNANLNLKFMYSSSNNSALTEALKLKEFAVFYYLKSLGLKGGNGDGILEKLSKEEKEQAVKLATDRRKLNVNKSEYIPPKSVMLLATRSSVHNSRTSKEQQAQYREKIKKWFMDIHKVAPELIDVAASCDSLNIIFDFESESVENVSLTGSNAADSIYPITKWIFVGAKLSDRSDKETKQREQKIKGVLAHELCHYVIKLIYENQANPYFKYREEPKKMFDKIVKIIDKWSAEDSENPDDECNGIISSVFKDNPSKDFHLELIARAVQILTEFDDNEQHSRYLQKKYKILYDFWQNLVIPELQNYLRRNKQIVKLNGCAELLKNILNQQIEVKPGKDINKLLESKLAIATTNHPTLLLIDICKNLKEKFGILIDSKNFFIKPEKLSNSQIWDEYQQICSENKELTIFVDCTEGVLEYLGNIFINKELNFIFVVSNKKQCEELVQICEGRDMRNAQKLEINYNWSDLTKKSQDLLLQTKINFQNNSQISLMDLLKENESQEQDFNELVDDRLLNMLAKKDETFINASKKGPSEDYFELLYKPRKFIEKTQINNKKIEHEILEVDLVSEIKNKQYVLISDKAGTGKSWAMQNFTIITRKKNPTSWVTYIDLKQFIDEFTAQKGELEFSTFMVEKILKLQQKFEAKIFQKLYKNGKVFILFDGFDEIPPDCAEFVSKLIQSFQFNGGNQLWIATRDYFEVDMMVKLKVDMAYGLEEMSEEDGIELIAKSWMLMDFKDSNEPKSKEDFENCIKRSQKYYIYLQKAVQIIEKALFSKGNSVGLPQIFKMITDGFKDEENVDDLQGSKIYDTFIKILHKRWFYEKGPIRQDASVDSQDFDLNFNKFHQFHAILSLFPKLARIFFHGYDGREWRQEEIIAGGILTIKNGKVYFIHETFREYFVADFITKALKKSEINENLVEVFAEVLIVEKFGVIRMFLNDMIDDSSILKKIQPQVQKYAEKFDEMTSFADFFTNNLQNLVDLVLEILKNGNYEKVKEILNGSAKYIAAYTRDLKMFQKFLEFIFNFLKTGDLKDLIIRGEVFEGIIKSSLEIKIFEDFVKKTEKIADQEFFQKLLMLKSEDWPNGNIFYFLALSSNLNADKVQKFIKVLQKFFTATEIYELMSKCNNAKQNILQVCVQDEKEENLKILWTEIENYFLVLKFPHSFKEFVKQQDNDKKNILHCAARCDFIEVHKTLWGHLLKIFEDREELGDFTLQKDEYGDNFIHELIRLQKNPAIIEFTFHILRDISSEAHFQEILFSKGLRENNLLQSAVFLSKDIEVHQFLWKFFRDFCGTDEKFLEMLKEVNEFGQNILQIATLNSSGDVFEFIIHELENIASQDEISELLRTLDDKNRNLLQLAVTWNESLELHKILWKTLRKYFGNSEKLQFINHVDNYGDNLLFKVVERNSRQIAKLTWNEIKNFLTRDEQVEYLKHKNSNGKNIESTAHSNRFCQNWIDDLLIEYGIISEEKKVSRSEEIKLLELSAVSHLESTREKMTEDDKKVQDRHLNPFDVIWRTKTRQNLYFTKISYEELTEVCKRFIIYEIKGEIMEYSAKKGKNEPKKMSIEDIISDTGCNLLMYAVRENHQAIKKLLTYNFDINLEDNEHRNAMDHAWINFKNSLDNNDKMNIEEIMLDLLKANSKLPKKKLKFIFDEAPQKVKEFITKCEDLHKHLANDEFDKFEDFLSNNLRYFYDRNNESLLLYALKLRKTDFIEKYGNILSIRKDEIYYELTRDPRTEFISNCPEIPTQYVEPHIILLKSKSEIYGKSYYHHKNWVHIDNIYKLLDKNGVCSKVLKIAAENKSLKIFFVPKDDEEVETVKSNNSDVTQTIFTDAHIYISANIIMEEEIQPTSSTALDDEFKIANILIYKLCRVVISMMCLDDFKIDEMVASTSKDIKGENIPNLEETVRNVFSSLFDYFQNLNIEDVIYILRILQKEGEIIKFESLPESMQQRILGSKVDFQGVDVIFSSIVDDNKEVLTYLPSKSISDMLIRNMTAKIGKSCKIVNNYEIVERKLIEHQTQEWNRPSSSDKEPKIRILVDDFGTGKTATFEAMSTKLKQESKSSWVSLIKLTNSTEILEKYFKPDIINDDQLAMKLLLELIDITSTFEATIFKNLFREGKVILLVDDIDKIEPKLTDFFMQVIILINRDSSNKLWITTCPVFLGKFKNKLEAKLYKFDPNFSPYNQNLVRRFFKEIKDVDKIPDELTSFISTLEDLRNGDHHSMLNCGLIRAIVEVYIENEADFKEDPVNFYSIFEKVQRKQQNIFSKYIFEKSSNPFESFSISKVHQVQALKLIFNDKLKEQLDDLAIMKNWTREIRKWPENRIGLHGFISFIENSSHFIHHTYAEFFVAEYLISYIFSDDYCIRDDEFEKVFKIIRFITRNINDFEIICKFIIGYAKGKDNECEELHETMRDVIKRNIQNIKDDINSSNNYINLKEFWTWIVKSDTELSNSLN